MATVSFYFDEMMVRKAVEQLTQHGFKVIMANDVGMTQKADEEHLAYATKHQLVMVSFDRPFAGRTMKQANHAGLICLSGSQDNIGAIVSTLIDFAQNYNAEEAAGQVFWL